MFKALTHFKGPSVYNYIILLFQYWYESLQETVHLNNINYRTGMNHSHKLFISTLTIELV